MKRMPPGSIKLQFAGDLILARCENSELAGFFKRFEALFESFANLEKQPRLLNYKLLNALILTSYAKKAKTAGEKHELFELKNNIFLELATNRALRPSLNFQYLVSKHFRVLEFCSECTTQNQEKQRERHEWKHCKKCKVDRDFYNVLALSHHFDKGHARIFLSNDLLHKVPFQKPKIGLGSLAETSEEAVLGKYHYHTRNLDAISQGSMLEMYERLMRK